MSKVSSNAGKHPYMRTDEEYVHLFDHLRIDKPGLKLNHDVTPKTLVKMPTEFSDKQGKRIYFKDTIIYEKEEYVIDYDSKEFYWIAENKLNSKKTFKLSKIATSTILTKKRNKS